MQTNEPLEHRVAWSYPNEFHPDTWIEQLLPKFIDEQIDAHYQAIEHYKEHVARWNQKDPAVSVPDAPMPSDMLMQACQVYAQKTGFTFETLAFSLLVAERKVRLLRRDRDHYKLLWDDSEDGQASAQMGE